MKTKTPPRSDRTDRTSDRTDRTYDRTSDTDSIRATFRLAPAEVSLRAAHRERALQASDALRAAAAAIRDVVEVGALLPLDPTPPPETARRPQGAHAILALVGDLAVCVACGHEGPSGLDFGYRWRGDRGVYTRRSRCKRCEGEGRRPAGR